MEEPTCLIKGRTDTQEVKEYAHWWSNLYRRHFEQVIQSMLSSEILGRTRTAEHLASQCPAKTRNSHSYKQHTKRPELIHLRPIFLRPMGQARRLETGWKPRHCHLRFTLRLDLRRNHFMSGQSRHFLATQRVVLVLLVSCMR